MYIHKPYRFEWDEEKSAYNEATHGLGFDLVSEFDWDNAVIVDRSRPIDGEHRYGAIGRFRDSLYTIIYTYRVDNIRIISMRRSNAKEEKTYEKTNAEASERL